MAKATKKTVKKIVLVKPLTGVSPEVAMSKIVSLKNEMTHAALESISVSILSLLLFIGAPSVFPEIINPYLPSSLKIMQAIIAVPTVFWLLTVLGNLVRYVMIVRLNKFLSSKK